MLVACARVQQNDGGISTCALHRHVPMGDLGRPPQLADGMVSGKQQANVQCAGLVAGDGCAMC